MKNILISAIRAYKKYLSLDTGLLPEWLGFARPVCPQDPPCSSYALMAIERDGALLGSLKAARRVLTCTPQAFDIISNRQ